MDSLRAVQMKILDIMRFIDGVCRKNGIPYCVMGGTALGAVRHGGFIPWDDDLDIFMTPEAYARFKEAMSAENDPLFVLQEWRTCPQYLEYAKVRMNGTTFIEKTFLHRRDLHQGIYVDIMILHKVPRNRIVQRIVYIESKFVTLLGLYERGRRPQTFAERLAFAVLKCLPRRTLAGVCYRRIYRYDGLKEGYAWCYWITSCSFKKGLFPADFFVETTDVPFEGVPLSASTHVKEYLQYRYGDYMRLPPPEQQKAAAHAVICDTEKDYSEYLRD